MVRRADKLDEANVALDPGTTEVLVTIQQLAADSMAGIPVTHGMEFARRVADTRPPQGLGAWNEPRTWAFAERAP